MAKLSLHQTTSISTLREAVYAPVDIASVCPICSHGFKDEHFTTLIWLDDHTPAHLSCCNEYQQYLNNENPDYNT